MILRVLVLALLSLALPPLAGAQGRPDSVSLRFGWPVGLTARVRHESIRIQTAPGRRDSVVVRGSYRLRVREHPDGRLIEIDSFTVPELSGLRGSSASATERQELMGQLAALQPSYVVSAQGDFIRAEGITRLKQAIDSLFKPLVRDMAGAPQEARALIERATSEQALTGAAAQEWNALVGTWAGADWVVGARYGLAAEEPLPLMPDLKIPIRYEYAAVERVRCAERGGPRDCVRLQLRSEPDSSALRKFVDDLMTRLGASNKELAASLANMRTETELTVIADPRTLVPYRSTRLRRITVTAKGAGAAERTSRVDIRTTRYEYAR